MIIRNIVNNTVAEITTCDSEPIHIPGATQSYGALIAVEHETGLVAYCSGNVAGFWEKTPEQLLLQPFERHFPGLWTQVMEIASDGLAYNHPLPCRFAGRECELIVHVTDDYLLLELEPLIESAERVDFHIFDQTSSFVNLSEKSKSLRELCQHVSDETRQLTGYDRVMIYRFDREGNGEVLAESIGSGIAPFLGLHYPHTDIPVQARALFLRNKVRMITDVSYEPVPMMAAGAFADRQIDLSDANLRAVSPIHIQYLKNMGVAASLTIAIVQNGKLWGLIACHHMAPMRISYPLRQQALLQAQFLSSQISVRQSAEEYDVNVSVEAHLQQLLNKLDADEEFAQKFEQLSSLLSVTNATGAVVVHNGQLFEKGNVPPRDKVLSLIRWIAKNIKSVSFSTAHLMKRYPDGKSIAASASGLIYHALGKPTENCILWFREELTQTVKWAGKPDTAVQKNAAKELTPRRSFETWVEEVRYQSAEWRISELNAGIRFATSLQNSFHLIHLRNEESKLRHLNEKLQKANHELSNINWITSHDLKEPLRKIQVFASRIIDDEGLELSEMIRDHTERINLSARRMQNLVDDIMEYSMASQSTGQIDTIDLNPIVNDVLSDFSAELEAARASVSVEPLPTQLQAVPGQMTQLFTHLLSNCIKFASRERPLQIEISYSELEIDDAGPYSSYHLITVRDNGIGFDPAYNQKIFDIFSRLHPNGGYEGTGIGLSLCRKIVENHEGKIEASGVPGEGASFLIYLPVK